MPGLIDLSMKLRHPRLPKRPLRGILAGCSVGLLACAAGCVTPQAPPFVPWPQVQPKYFGVAFDLSSGTNFFEMNNRTDILAKDAPRLLRTGLKVAFRPPDDCKTTKAGPEAAKQDNLIVMKCGVLMSSLETTAGMSGYQVVSWQLLQDLTVVEAARTYDVDVVFEIDQYSTNDREGGITVKGGLQFFEESAPDQRVPVAVTADVAERCKAFVGNLLKLANSSQNRREDSATLAVKAVDTRSGRAIFYYKKSLKLPGAEDGQKTKSTAFYFDAQGHYPFPQPVAEVQQGYNKKQKNGAEKHSNIVCLQCYSHPASYTNNCY